VLLRLLRLSFKGSIAIMACCAVVGSSEALRDTSAALIAIFARRAVVIRISSPSLSLLLVRLSHASSICGDQNMSSYLKVVETLFV
jgi:hypothetical protein